MLNPEVLKCHEDKEKQWIISFTYICENNNIFGYVGGWGGGGGASIIRLGPSWFTYTLYLIIIYMSNIEAI